MDIDVSAALDAIAQDEVDRGMQAAEILEMREIVEGVLNGDIDEAQATKRLEALGFDVMPSDVIPDTGPWADWGTWAQGEPEEDSDSEGIFFESPDGDSFVLDQEDLADEDFAKLFWERITRSERLHRRSRNIQLGLIGGAVALVGAAAVWKWRRL